jgi:hypothetical protein
MLRPLRRSGWRIGLSPLNPRDTLTFAHALAEVGSEEAAPFIEKVRAFSPGEAATSDGSCPSSTWPRRRGPAPRAGRIRGLAK